MAREKGRDRDGKIGTEGKEKEAETETERIRDRGLITMSVTR